MSLQLPPRAWIEASIESLIAMLDHLDGDADMEDGHDREEVGQLEPKGGG